MFDDRSWSSSSFDARSWFGLGEVIEVIRDYAVRFRRRLGR